MSGVFSRRAAPAPKAAAPTPPPAPQAAEPDPSMEDILASIRRILNEGETESPDEAETLEMTEAAAPSPGAEVAAPEPAPTEAQEAPMQATVEQQNASTDPKKTVEDTEVFILEPAMMVTENAAAPEVVAPIASNETMNAASQSVGALKKALAERNAQVYRLGNVSLEDLVRDEVRPMLRDWLDTHLPAIVERLVRAEIERVVAREIM